MYKYLHVYLVAVQTQAQEWTVSHILTSQPDGQSPTIEAVKLVKYSQ